VEYERCIELEIDEKTLNETTQCHRDFSCLTNNDRACCEVEKCLARNILLMKSLDKEYCNYRMFAANSYVVCGCPTRKEIYKKYNLQLVSPYLYQFILNLKEQYLVSDNQHKGK